VMQGAPDWSGFQMAFELRRCAAIFAMVIFSAKAFASADARVFHAQIAEVARDLPGAAAIVVVGGESRPLFLHGFQSLNDVRPITADTQFQLASLSKSIAATAAALAVEQNKISWGAQLETVLPDIQWGQRHRAQQLKVFHLASQSTGLWPHAYTNLIEERLSYSAIKARLNEVAFVCDPGACYSYQNVVFSLIGDVINKSTGESFEGFVQTQVFIPLNMKDASIGPESLALTNMAKPHVATDEGWRVAPFSKRYYKVAPAAGVNASIADMQQWLLAQLGLIDGLSATVRARIQNRYVNASRADSHYPADPRIGSVGYGLGWRTFSFAGVAGFFHHGGYVKGMRSEMIFHPETASGMVFLTNSEPQGLNQLSLLFAQWLVERSGLVDRAD